MHHALDIRSGLHDLQVQQHFAGALLAAAKLPAVHIDEANVVGRQETFSVHGVRAEDFVIIEPHGDIAVIGSGKPALVNAVADFADRLL
jgi:hypothetical protein